MILTSVILSQYTRAADDRQTEDRRTVYNDNSRTLQYKLQHRFAHQSMILNGKNIYAIIGNKNVICYRCNVWLKLVVAYWPTGISCCARGFSLWLVDVTCCRSDVTTTRDRKYVIMAVPRMVVLGSFCLILALITCGISFFAPYWLGNYNKSMIVSATRRLMVHV